MKKNKIEGIYIVNKPVGISSQKAVQFVKYWARKKTSNRKIRVGHAGTLDPLAEGVLVIAVGRDYTKKINEIVESEKKYIAEVKLGEFSSTDDAEGEKSVQKVNEIPNIEKIQKVLQKFTGKIKQIPPSYSAIKVNGLEAYKRVRDGEELEMKERVVEIKKIELLNYEYPFLKIEVICGKGTYIRSLARDIGKELKTGGYLSFLKRTKVGQFSLKNTYEIFEFKRNKSLKEKILTWNSRIKRIFN